MALGLDIAISRKTGIAPSFEIHGDDDIALELINNVKVDIELLADDDGNPFFRLRLPDRKMILLKSAPVSGNLFFRLEENLKDMLSKPGLYIVYKYENKKNISHAIGWRLIDFSGAYDRALHFAAKKQYGEAADSMAASVVANSKHEGFRVVWGRYLLACDEKDKAFKIFNEELDLFPHSYRALFELARLEKIQGKEHEALEYLNEGLSIYPNHLNSLLLAGEIYLKSNEEMACKNLSRAWRLSSALNPARIHTILKNAGKESLLPDLRVMASNVQLDTTFGGDKSFGGKTDKPSSDSADKPASDSADKPSSDSADKQPAVDSSSTVFNEKYDESSDSHQLEVLEVACSELKREDIVKMAAVDIYRDGKVTAEEKMVFKNLCKAFPLAPEKIKEIVGEVKSSLKVDKGSGDFDCREFFTRVIKVVFGDNKVSKDEVSMVLSLATVLGLSREECMEIQKAVRAQSGQ